MYAIDSLRQLGMKYLEREEHAKFTFQNDILKPFVILMRNSRSATIRTLIVDCIVQVKVCAYDAYYLTAVDRPICVQNSSKWKYKIFNYFCPLYVSSRY